MAQTLLKADDTRIGEFYYVGGGVSQLEDNQF